MPRTPSPSPRPCSPLASPPWRRAPDPDVLSAHTSDTESVPLSPGNTPSPAALQAMIERSELRRRLRAAAKAPALQTGRPSKPRRRSRLAMSSESSPEPPFAPAAAEPPRSGGPAPEASPARRRPRLDCAQSLAFSPIRPQPKRRASGEALPQVGSGRSSPASRQGKRARARSLDAGEDGARPGVGGGQGRPSKRARLDAALYQDDSLDGPAEPRTRWTAYFPTEYPRVATPRRSEH